YGLHNLFPRQPRILEHRKLMAHLVSHLSIHQILIFPQVIIKLGSGIGVRDRDLDRFAIELLGKLDRPLDCLWRLTRETNDEVPMNDDSELLTVLHELAGLLDGGALLDVFEYLRIARLKADDQQPATGFLHRLERLVIGVNSRSAGPRLPDWLQ